MRVYQVPRACITRKVISQASKTITRPIPTIVILTRHAFINESLRRQMIIPDRDKKPKVSITVLVRLKDSTEPLNLNIKYPQMKSKRLTIYQIKTVQNALPIGTRNFATNWEAARRNIAPTILQMSVLIISKIIDINISLEHIS